MSEQTDPKTLRADIDKCNTTIKEVKENFDIFKKATLIQTHEEITNFTDQLNRVETELGEIDRRQEKFMQIGEFLLNNEDFFNQLDTIIKKMKKSLKKHKGKIKQLDTENKEFITQISTIDQKIKKHDEQLSQIEEFNENEQMRLDELKEDILNESEDYVNQEIQELNEKIDREHKKNLDELKDEQKEQLTELSNLIQNVEKNSIDLINELTSNQEQLEERIANDEDELKQLKENLNNVEKKQNDESTRIDTLYANLDELQKNTIKKISDDIKSLEETISTNKEQLEQEDENIHREIEELKNLFAEQNDGNQKSFSEIGAEIQNLKNEDIRIEQKLDESVSNLKDLIRQLDEKTCTNLREQVNILDDRINQLQTKFDEHSEANDLQFQDIHKIIVEIHNTEKEMKENHDKLAQLLDTKEGDLNIAITELSEKFVSIHTELFDEYRKCSITNNEIKDKIYYLQGDKKMSMTDLSNILERIERQVDETTTELTNGLNFAKERMLKDIQTANETNARTVESLQEQIDNQKESIKQVLTEQIQNANIQFRQTMNEMNVDSTSIRKLLCQFFGIDDKTLSLTFSINNISNNENGRSNFAFQKNLPEIIQLIIDIDKRAQESSTQLNTELNDFANSIFEEFESFDILKSEVEKRNSDLDVFKELLSNKVEELNANTEKVKLSGENINKKLSSIEDRIDQTNNRIDREDDQVKNDLDTLRNQMKLSEDSIKTSIQSRFETFTTNYKETIANIELNSQQISEKMNGIFGESGMTFNSFLDVIKNIRDEENRLFKSSEKTNQKIEQIQSDIDAYSQHSAEINETVTNRINEMRTHFQTILDNNAKTTDEQLRAAQTDLQRSIETIDKRFVDFIGSENSSLKMADVIARIEEVDKNSKDADLQLNNRNDELETNFNTNFAKLTTACHKLNKNIEVRKSEIENLQKQTKNNLIEIATRISNENLQITNKVNQNHDETLHLFDEVKNNFVDVRNSINNVQNESHFLVTDLENRINDLLIKSQDMVLNSVEASIKSINDNFEEVRKTINNIQGKDGNDIPSVLKKMSTLEKYVESQFLTIQEYNAQVNQDINNIINANKVAVNERIDQFITNSNSKAESIIKMIDNQNSQNLQRIEKMNSSINTKLKQLDEKIINLDDGSGITMKNLYDAFTELNTSLHAEFTKTANEINKLKKKQERQPETIKDALTNEIRSIISGSMTDSSQVSSKMNEINGKLEDYATNKSLLLLEKRLSDLEEKQINEILQNQEQIINEVSNYTVKFAKEVNTKLEKYYSKLNALRETVTHMNGDAEESLGQAIEKINNIQKDLLIEKSKIDEINNFSTNEISESKENYTKEINSINLQIEEIRQQYSTDNKKIVEDIKENYRLIQDSKTQFESQIKSLEVSTKDQISQTEKQIITKYTSYTSQIDNKISKIDNDINITKSSFEKASKHQSVLTRTSNDTLGSLRAYIDSQIEIFNKALENLHAEISNETDKLLNNNSSEIMRASKEMNDKTSQTIDKLKTDLEKLKGGSLLSIPMIIDQINSVSEYIKTKEKENENRIRSFDEKISIAEQNSLDKIITKSSKLKNILKSLQEQMENNKEQFNEAILKSQGMLRDEIKSLDKRISATINENKDLVDESIKQINEKQKLTQAKYDNKFSKVDIQFSNIDSRFIENQEEEKNHFAEFFRKTFDKVNDKNNKNLEQINRIVQKNKLEIQEKFDDIIDINSKLQFFLSDAQLRNNQNIQKDQVSINVKNEIITYFDQFKESIQNRLNNLKNEIQATNDTIDEIKSENSISYQTVESKIEATNSKLDDLKDTFSKQLKSAVDEVQKVNSDFKGDVSEVNWS